MRSRSSDCIYYGAQILCIQSLRSAHYILFVCYMPQVFGDVGSIGKFSLIESASVVMYCDNTSMSNTPSPSVHSIPTIPPQKNLEDMCASVRNLTNALSNGDSVSGTCTNSETCLNVSCNLEMQVDFLTVQLALSVTLLPCESPFAIYVNAEITILGQTTSLVDGNFSANATIPVTLPFVSGTVTVVIIQQDCGILLSVSSH